LIFIKTFAKILCCIRLIIITNWQYYKNNGLDSREAVRRAYDYTSRPIQANAFGLAIGLSALFVSPIRLYLYVAILMWVAMMAGEFFSHLFQ